MQFSWGIFIWSFLAKSVSGEVFLQLFFFCLINLVSLLIRSILHAAKGWGLELWCGYSSKFLFLRYCREAVQSHGISRYQAQNNPTIAGLYRHFFTFSAAVATPTAFPPSMSAGPIVDRSVRLKCYSLTDLRSFHVKCLAVCPTGYPLSDAAGGVQKCSSRLAPCPGGYECSDTLADAFVYGQMAVCCPKKGLAAGWGSSHLFI